MEQKNYQNWYLPETGAKLISYDQLIAELLAPAGEYKKPGMDKAFIFSLLSKISSASENYFGPTFGWIAGGEKQPLPLKWLPIIDYLYKENLIERLFFDKFFHDEPRIIQAIIVAAFDKIMNDSDGRRPRNTRFAIGRTLNINESVAKCLGEFLERFPLIIYKEKDFLRSSVKDLAKARRSFINIDKLAGFSEKQKSINSRLEYDENSQFLWLEGESLFRKGPILIPSQLVFWNYKFDHQSWMESYLREANTNGAGGHCSLARAILSGIYELAQRDGFLIYWLNHQAPPKINLDVIDSRPLKEFLDECSRLGFEIEFFNTTSNLGIPSCICAVYDHSSVGPKLTFGGGCSFNWEKILTESLIEAMAIESWTRRRLINLPEVRRSLREQYIPHQDRTIDQAGRMNIWAEEKMFKNFDFFRKGKQIFLSELKKEFPRLKTPEEELEWLVKDFKNLGEDYEIFYYQAKHKALDDLGYFSVKVIIPPLVTLYLRENYAPLGAKRLKEVPEKLGFRPAKEWNPWPHPFP